MMREIYSGHLYEMDHLDGNGTSRIQFVQRPPHHEAKEGIILQELYRVAIARIKVLDAEKPWEGNARILRNLRECILLHEIRALERKVERREIDPEDVPTGEDGHWELKL
jgi:hypothetical protein